MKLIIDIPEEVYDFTMGAKTARFYNTEYYVNLILKGTPLEEEFEKISAEIIACTQQEEGTVPDCINYGIKLSTEIVEKHISELKGANNE